MVGYIDKEGVTKHLSQTTCGHNKILKIDARRLPFGYPLTVHALNQVIEFIR